MFLIMCLYLIAGIITMVPLIACNSAFNPSAFDELKEFDEWLWLGVGIGALWTVLIWPYWIGYIIYKTYKDD